MTISARGKLFLASRSRPTRIALAAIVLASTIGAARSQEPSGCDKFSWPLERERAALLAPSSKVTAAARPVSPEAFRLSLVPVAEAGLPTPPERAPKEGTRAAAVTFEAPAAGIVQVTLSANAWLDLVQDGRFIKAAAFTGVHGCPGIRKSVRFPVTATPFTVQLSGATDETMAVIVQALPPQ